ncbi:hypothetical protein GBAR_LOCUS6260 [Geodia barretti]|uniref:Uncharacterized protein n=1 Tax=Geodia barretti TaxID=519541 RepID=A0AA35W5V6_GEOBA|nr:hypothetical protein GBAR_LOCUS6260 [Geodia barretti]
MEGLFSHFFSADRRGYHEEDMRWFLELANQQDDWCVPHVSDIVIGGTSEQDLIPKDAISMCTFKMYLSRLLGECDRQNEDPARCGPLLLHQYHPRLQVGQALVKKASVGSSGPYIPTFYQESPGHLPPSRQASGDECSNRWPTSTF